MERVRPIQRNASTAAEADSYRPELIADDEPRYLRRQKPVEIRRKKFSGRGWPFYKRLLVLSAGGVVGATAAYYGMQFLLYSPSMLLLKPDQIEVNGNRIVSREAILQQFVHDRNRSVLQVPLEARRGHISPANPMSVLVIRRSPHLRVSSLNYSHNATVKRERSWSGWANKSHWFTGILIQVVVDHTARQFQGTPYR